ncbi:hypothetical protein Mmc1_1938 [Magnetococcus marinus MC-1]|uniref:Uncharacterized protein n=1 Tax=Magnetococcus marinus (strain ATCC BAA-1437 / JCM 17883 / MC-1) TaxID=156889 RepID=A0L903_MAGMM|nr:hypothetical protein [Magnetococcus marinus]ABK44446.1 hypothetical protein Mmc1_1938 [Magnetococcus marinus MC-1]
MSENTPEKNEMLLKFVVEFDKRFTLMEEDIEAMRVKVDKLISGEGAANPEEWAKVQKSVKDLKDGLARNHKAQSHIEKRVDTVKKDSNSGLVISIVIFTLLFVVSLFIRS